MSIRQATSPSLIGKTNIPIFQKDDFEALIFNKGLDIVIEQAIECPCKGKSDAYLPTCQNCFGLGWIFLNPIQTKAIVSSINSKTKYQQWSPELTGIVNVTVRDTERFSYMDKITLKNKTSVLSEVRPVIETGSQKFIFCSYPVRKINSVYIFESEALRLIKLPSDEYSIKQGNNMVVKLENTSFPDDFNGVVSIDYEHEIQYNIIDIPHDIRSTFILNERGQNMEANLPVQGVARRSHLVMKSTNYAGDNLIDNNE